MNQVHAVIPTGIDDARRPSGGNVYDRRVLDGLRGLGWTVHEHPVPGPWSNASSDVDAALEAALRRPQDGDLVLLDGLVVSASPRAVAPAADRLRLVLVVHLPWGHEHPDVAAEERAAFGAAAAVVTTSHWTRDWLVAEYGLPASLLHVVVPGAEPADVVRGTETGGELLCVGAVVPGKGHDLLLSALEEVADLDWRCTCVGALDLDAEFVATVRRTAEAGGLSHRVEFSGARTGSALKRAYETSDLLVLASRGETYGMVVTEALAHGLPVVATAVGGVREALGLAGDHRDPPGVLVPTESPSALAGVLRDWLTGPELRAHLRRLAEERRKELPAWTQSVRAFTDLLARVAAEPLGRPLRKGG